VLRACTWSISTRLEGWQRRTALPRSRAWSPPLSRPAARCRSEAAFATSTQPLAGWTPALRWFIVGSVAARNPDLAVAICVAAHGHVLLSLDVRAGVARVEGWTEDGATAAELLREWRTWPAAGVVYTDTARDGLLAGPDLDGLRSCIELYGGPVIASGGIGSLDDITACAAAGAAGVIVGKALYEGRVDLALAMRAVESAAS